MIDDRLHISASLLLLAALSLLTLALGQVPPWVHVLALACCGVAWVRSPGAAQ